MGCISSFEETSVPYSSVINISSKQAQLNNNQLKIISFQLDPQKNIQLLENEKDSHCTRINKAQFIDQQSFYQPTQNIIFSNSQLTTQDKQMLDEIISRNYIFFKLSGLQRKQLIDKFVVYESSFQVILNEKSPLVESDPYLFKKNDLATMFFVVKEGNVDIQLDIYEKNHRKIMLRRGDAFGQLALLYDIPRTASAKCLGKCTFLCLTDKIFSQMLKKIVQRTAQTSKILIQRIKLFQYLSLQQKTKLANQVILLKYEKGDVVFRQGQQSLAFFVIVSGRVEIKIQEKPLLQLKSGDYFGESCFHDNQRRLGTVQCSQKTQLMLINRIAIQKVLGNRIQQFYNMSILKWALKRNPILKQLPPKSAEKLLKQCDIIHFIEGHQLQKYGEKVRKLFIPIQGTINCYELGDIVNCEHLPQIQKDKKTSIINQIPLIKKKDGFVCVIDINKLLSILEKHTINISQNISREFEDMKKLISSKKEIQHNRIKTIKHIKKNNSFILMQNLAIVTKICIGQFGYIYKVRHTIDNSFYALKTFNKTDVHSYKMKHFIKQQIQTMKIIGQHKFIVEFFKYFQTDDYVMILMELIEGKDLFDTILQIGWLNSDLIRFFFASFVLALEFLHQNDIIYRDIKPQNAVVEPSGYLKIIDMGTARKLNPLMGYRSFTIIGTPHYMAPQIVAGKGYSFEADIWSMGVLLYELACGQFPFGQKLQQPIDIYNQIIKWSFPIPFPKELKDASLKGLISRLLVKDPSIRSIQNFSQIKDSEFYQNFEWQKFEAKTLRAPYRPDPKQKLYGQQENQDQKDIEQNLIIFMQKLQPKSRKDDQKYSFEDWQLQ